LRWDKPLTQVSGVLGMNFTDLLVALKFAGDSPSLFGAADCSSFFDGRFF
jgi:hypothetical protein